MKNRARWLGYGAASILLVVSVYGCSDSEGSLAPNNGNGNLGAKLDQGDWPTSAPAPTDVQRIAPWRLDTSITPEARHKMMLERYAKRVSAAPYATLEGIVIDPDGKPLKGIKISVAPMGALPGKAPAAVTDENGQFVMNKVDPGPVVMSFEHAKYVFKQEIVTLQPSDKQRVRTSLLPRRAPQHFDADTGAVVKEGFVTVKFTPDMLVYEANQQPVKGDVEAIVTPIDPRRVGDIESAPARLEGITVDGRPTTLMSYGMVEVELYQEGQKLNVRPGASAELEFEIDGMLATEGLVDIPMWHHDHKSGYWVQERGIDAKITTNEEGHTVARTSVPHFSSWNVDSISDSICTTMLLRRVMTTSPPTNFLPTSIQVRGTAPDGTGQYWTITPHRTTYPGGAARYTFNAPNGRYGKWQHYRIMGQNNVSTANPNPPMEPLMVRYPNTESNVIVAKNINDYIIQKTGMSNGTGDATAGNWCGPLPTDWVWGAANHFDALSWNASGNDQIQFFTSGTVDGKPMSQWRMRFTYALRPAGTTFVENAAQMAQDIVLANPNGDVDSDGHLGADNCPYWPNPSQNDSDGNGWGDACESYCIVLATTPNASWYDSDGDEVDDWCDNNPWVNNPTQLTDIVYDF